MGYHLKVNTMVEQPPSLSYRMPITHNTILLAIIYMIAWAVAQPPSLSYRIPIT